MKKIILIMLLSVFLLSAMTVPSLSQDVTVGVSVGDWFKYEPRILDWIAGADVPFPPDEYTEFFYTYDETAWEKLTVTDIAGSNVTFDVLLHWKNGTETTYGLEINVTSSRGIFEETSVIEANLEAGDLYRDEFYLFGFLYYPPSYLNESIMVDYVTETRETNVLDYESPTVNPEDSVHTRQLWDKETGVMVKVEAVMNNTSALGQKYFITYEIELVDSSVWVIPEFPTGTVMLLIFVAATACVGIYRRRKLKGHMG